MNLLRTFGGAAASTLAFLSQDVRGQASPEMLFGIKTNSGCCNQFERLSTVNSLPEFTLNFNAYGVGIRGLGWTGTRLLTYSTATNPNRLATFHPADAGIVALSFLSFTNLFIGKAVERDPMTGVIYVALPDKLYVADPVSGALTFRATFTGFKATWDRMHVMGIDATGSAFVIGANDGATRHAYYQLDLATGQLNWIADLIVPNGYGYFWDVAISNTGDIWASYGASGLNPNANGLYKIDPNSLAVTKIRYMPEPYLGLAFVPGNVEAVYCAPKASSIGCLPTISSDGFPSPTASSGYWIRAGQVRNQTSGTLAFSLGARSATPFGGGTLCVAPPLRRTGSQPSGGATAPVADCSGSWELDFNAWMAQNTGLPAGTTVRVQWLGRDPGFAAPNNWSLSDALEFDLRP